MLCPTLRVESVVGFSPDAPRRQSRSTAKDSESVFPSGRHLSPSHQLAENVKLQAFVIAGSSVVGDGLVVDRPDDIQQA